MYGLQINIIKDEKERIYHELNEEKYPAIMIPFVIDDDLDGFLLEQLDVSAILQGLGHTDLA
jgi:hypothetical protein